MMAKVFVTHEQSQVNYLDAERFGDLTTVSAFDVIPHSDNMQLWETIRKRLANFDPLTDYVLYSGSPIITAFCFVTLARQHPGSVIRVLRWDKHAGRYSVVQFPLY
jgi:hypothetical protein